MFNREAWIPYCGSAPIPAEIFGRWNLDPILLLALGLAVLLVMRYPDMRALERRVAIGAIGLALVLFVSPFCALTSALFSARAVHHLFLTAILPPMLIAAFPRLVPLAGGALSWTTAHALVFWAWHVPQAYAWALASDLAYWLMQATLWLSALALWSAIRRAPVTSAVAALLGTMVQMGLLGALLTFAQSALYAPHFIGPIAWGLSPLEDQQLAGLIMWAPGAGIYLAAAIALLARSFARERAATLAG
ncbi:cytochrome c oxidase assembly protein [Sphingomonas sp. ID0503]|uniref:cytochrome c oxidase assembly protein n=1 Tax=Sphingomonas sp. ID0503 TaxID=3399691 RepID=UPI003AFB3FEB